MTLQSHPSLLCQQVEDQLTALLERPRPVEIAAHIDHCERCRDLIRYARVTAEQLHTLGADFIFDETMIDRLLDRAKPRIPESKTNTPTPSNTSRSRSSMRNTKRAGSLIALWQKSVPLRVAFLAACVLAATWALVAAGENGSILPSTPAAVTIGADSASWVVLESARGRRGASPKVELQLASGGWVQLGRDHRIAPGSTLRTDAQTKATLRLAEGTTILLNRNTQIAFIDGDRLDLQRGELLADVRERPAAHPLAVKTPTGKVEVLGTKFNLAADGDLAQVDVIRGLVRLRGQGDAMALVGPGQEGVTAKGAPPRVALAADLGQTVAWADSNPSDDAAPMGLGSLQAKRPGRSTTYRLRLASHQVRVRIAGGLARTEITEVFSNATQHTLEGIYRFPLPNGARISRLALVVDGRLEEGTIVERNRAQKIWRGVLRQATPKRLRKKNEEYVWVPGPWKDPALLQWRKGSQFELRIFPIPAHGSRKVILAYTESLPRTARGYRYVYPLPDGANKELRAERFSVDVRLSEHDPLAPLRTPTYRFERWSNGAITNLRFDEDNLDPRGDLVIDFGVRQVEAKLAVHTYRQRGGQATPGFALLSLRPTLPPYRNRRPLALAIVVDRSYSTLGEASRRQLMIVQTLIAEAGRKNRVAVASCDSRCQDLGAGWVAPSAKVADRLVDKLGRVRPGGATNIGRALLHGGALLRRRPTGYRARLIYVGDGVATLGELELGRLRALATRSLSPMGARLTTIGVGADVDAKLLTALARATGGSYVPYAPGTRARGQALFAMARQAGVALDRLSVDLPPGLSQVAPRALATLYQGETLTVAARVARGVDRIRGPLTLRGRVNGEPFSQTVAIDAPVRSKGGNAFLPRRWAQLRIDDLAAERQADHRAEIVSLSKRHHLLSRYTSLLVLESEAMRRAFGVRRAHRTAHWSGKEALQDEQGADPAASTNAVGVGRGGPFDALGRLGVGSGGGGGSFDFDRGPTTRRRRGPAYRRRGLDSLGGLIGDTSSRNAVRGRRGERNEDSGAREPTLGGAKRGKGKLGGKTKGWGAEKRRRFAPGGGQVGDRIPRAPLRHPARATVRGALDRSVIQRVIRSRIREIRAAYERQLQSQPNLAGALQVRFVIDRTGRVILARAEGNVGSSALNREIERVIKRLRFPSAAGGGMVQVVYPFVFRPSGGPAANASTPPNQPLPRDQRWVRMKRVYFQQASVRRWRMAQPDGRLIRRLRRRLAQAPLSRDRHRRLIDALYRAGRVRQSLTLIEAWLRKEPQSEDALRRSADALARLGRRDEALRRYGSLLEITSHDLRLRRALAKIERAAGRPQQTCEHYLSLQSLQPTDSTIAQWARDCRAGFRPRAESGARSAFGRVRLVARWSVPHDLDLSLVDGRGRRYSWLSLRRRQQWARATAKDGEELAISWLPAGRYRVELSRSARGAFDDPVSGTLRVIGPGTSRRLRFRLEGQRRYVAELRIVRRSRLVSAP